MADVTEKGPGDDPAITVLIADDDPVVRFGLTMMLRGTTDLRVVAEACDGAEAIELAARHHLGLATVKTHVSAILTKLDLDNRVQIALLVHDADLDLQA